MNTFAGITKAYNFCFYLRRLKLISFITYLGVCDLYKRRVG